MNIEPAKKRHILVTGVHRSGTTFVGKMLSAAPGTGYVQEPFNPDFGMEGIDAWYQYITEGMSQESYYADIVRKLISGQVRFKKRSGQKDSFLRKIGKKIFGSKDYLQYLASTRLPGSKRLILKDPLAALSSEWFHQKFEMDVLILLRHPAAFISSTKRLGWDFDFSNLTGQTPLMEEYLNPILAPHDTISMTPWQRGALLWQCIYTVLDVFEHRNPGMKIVRLEDISSSPEEKFREIHKFMNLPFTEKSLNTIRESTSSDNPVNASEGQAHLLKRNSRRLSDVWRKNFDKETLNEIKKLAGPLAVKYYGEDW